ncbi:MAG: glutamate 5-kinase, partial [Treponema maltophilum]
MNVADAIAGARKIVIKIGSNTLAKADGTINTDFMDGFAAQCADLIARSKQLVIVSSGAQVAGMSALNRWTRKKDIHYRQALCAIGQVELMYQWRAAFFKYGIHIGQLLFTKEDFTHDYRTLNMRNTLFTLVDEGVLPVINENDSVCVEEIRIGDNDNLSALTAELWSADLLILFSDIDGVYTA